MTPYTVRPQRPVIHVQLIAVVSAALAVTGCATLDAGKQKSGTLRDVLSQVEGTPSENGVPSVPTPLVRYIEADDKDGKRNRVLNDMQAGMAAFEFGAVGHARAALQDAYVQIETIYADNDAAKAARSTFAPEESKDFKGEPYERAMVGYYLGMSDMMVADFENARASFRWGEFQDTMSASESYQSDMSLLAFLAGWSHQCQGAVSGAAEYYARSQTYRSGLAAPKSDANLLLIAEIGSAPVKYRTGKYGEELRYKQGEATDARAVTFEVAGKSLDGVLAEDLYFQATTLGGRAVDKILAGKASFKQGAETTAAVAGAVTAASLDVAMISQLQGDQDMANLAGGLAGAGLLVNMFSSFAAAKAKPAADIRAWDTLPERFLVATTRVKEKPKQIAATFFNESGDAIQTVDMNVHETGPCYLAWVREKPTAAPWAPAAPDAWTALDTSNITSAPK